MSGKIIEKNSEGAGAVDAIYKTIDLIVEEPINLIDYTLQSVTEGTDALGEVVVRIKDKTQLFTGRGSSTDIVMASTKAYLNAINKMINCRHKNNVNANI